MTEPQPFKNHYNAALVADLAARISAVAADFPTEAFVAQVVPALDPLELKGRVNAIADGLRDYLPHDYPTAIGILLATLGPPHSSAEGMFSDGWALMPVAAFVERHGLRHFDESLAAMHAITQRHTAEFAIRPFLLREPARTLAVLHTWASDPSMHVRRLVSEGSRTRLPWASRLPLFIADPAPVLALLELLKDDPAEYVRRSVANNLNDIAKDHPELVLATLARWSIDASPTRRGLIRHALRTFVKQGHPEALRLLGANRADVQLTSLTLSPPTVRLGESLTISATISNLAPQAQYLIIDYLLHFPAANGQPRQKVFKLKSLTLEAGATITLSRRHSFRPVTIRRYYPGSHHISIQVNGQIVGMGEVLVTA